MLVKNLNIAADRAAEMKAKDSRLRFRFETRINSDSVKLYVISGSKIIKVITVDDGAIKSISHKC